LVENFLHAQLAALETGEQLARGRGRRLRLRRDLDERQQRADAIQAVLDRRIAHAEELLHLLDGSVAAHEGGDERLVLARQAGERRKLEWSLDHDVLLDQPRAQDLDRAPRAELAEHLPFLAHVKHYQRMD